MSKSSTENLVSVKTLFQKFFINYFWVGVVVVLIAIIIDNKWEYSGIEKIVFIDLFKTVGISIIVASIFSYASGTNQFISSIKRLLERIVIQRDFLGNIDSDSKRTALKSLLQPTDDEKNIYSKIHEYYSQFIEEALSIGDKSIREDYALNCIAKYDKDKKKIIVDANYSFSMYRTLNGFKKITLGFEEGEEESTFDKLCVRNSIGKPILEKENIELTENVVNGAKTRKVELDVPDTSKDEKRIRVHCSLTEVGQDHWCLLTFNNLQPTN